MSDVLLINNSSSLLINGSGDELLLNESGPDTAPPTMTDSGSGADDVAVGLGARYVDTAGGGAHLSASSTSLQGGSFDFWVAGWFYLETLTGYQAIIAKDTTSPAGDDYREWFIDVEAGVAGGELRFGISSNGSSLTGSVQTNTDPQAGAWYFFLAWYDHDNETLNIRLNDITAQSASYSSGAYQGLTPVTFGRRTNDNARADARLARMAFGRLAGGMLDDVIGDIHTRLFNDHRGRRYDELTSQEATDWGLEAYWNGDEPSGSMVDAHAGIDAAETGGTIVTALFDPVTDIAVTDSGTGTDEVTVQIGIGGTPVPAILLIESDPGQSFTDAGKTDACEDSETAYVAADDSFNGWDLTQATAGSRPTWLEDADGNRIPAFEFGSDDFMESSEAIEPGDGEFTVLLFLKLASLGGTQVIAGKGNPGSTTEGWLLFVDGGTIIARCNSGNGATNRASQTVNLTTAGVSAEDWLSIGFTITRGGGSTTITGYVNGSNADFTNGGGGPSSNVMPTENSIDAAAYDFFLGQRSDGSLRLAAGTQLRALLVCDEALSQPTIQAVHDEYAAVSLGETDTGSSSDSEPVITAVVEGSDDAFSSDAEPVIAAAVTETDTGSGADEATGTENEITEITVADTGAGSDSEPVIAAAVTEADTGAGDDTPTRSIATTVTDTGAGVDAITIAVSFSLTETGGGDDAVTQYSGSSVTVTDAGSGADEVSIDRDTAISDSGIGADSEPVITVTPATITDSGTGVETLTITKTLTITITDSGSGSDAVTSYGGISETDSAAGSDSVSVSALSTLADAGSGADSVSQPAALVTVPEAGTGSESIAVPTVSLTVTETGAGADEATGEEAPVVEVTDAGSGSDAETVTALVSEADAAAGADDQSIATLTSIFERGLAAESASIVGQSAAKTISDSGSGSDAVAVFASLALAETGSGSDLETVAGLATVTDAGSSSDAVNSPTVLATVTDSGAGADVDAVLAGVTVTDSGAGTDETESVPAVSATVTDTGEGTEAVTITATGLTVTDSGGGVDAESVAALSTVSDSGAGVDAIEAPTVLATLADTGSGDDAIATAHTVTVTDAGETADSGPTITTLASLTDAAAGSDTFLIAAAVDAGGDSGAGTDAVSAGALVTQADTGSGVDTIPALGTITQLTDSGIGTEAIDAADSRELILSAVGGVSARRATGTVSARSARGFFKTRVAGAALSN